MYTTAAIGEPLVYINGDGKKTHCRYDSRGNCTVVIDALGNETDTAYNLANQVTGTAQYTPWSLTSNPHGLISKVVYGYLYVGGPMISEQTQDSTGTAVRETDYSYGHEGELLSESAKDFTTSPTTSHTLVSYTYDALYRVASITDGNSNTTKYTYSPSGGHLILTQYPGAGTNTTGADTVRTPYYDADGQLLSRIDGNGVTTSYLYDDLSSLLTKQHYTYPTGYAGTQIADVTHTYDSYGRHKSVTDGVFLAVGTNPGESFSYDDLDNLTSKAIVRYSLLLPTLHLILRRIDRAPGAAVAGEQLVGLLRSP